MGQIHPEHLEVLQTLCEQGVITKWAMRSLRGQVISMKTHEEREIYLRKVVKTFGQRQKKGQHDGQKTAPV